MNDGKIVQTEFISSFNKNSAASSGSSTITISKLPTNQKKYLYQYGLFGLLIILSLIILSIVTIILSKIPSYSIIPIGITSIVSNKWSERNLVNSILLEDMLVHLRQFDNRPIGTISFNRTIDYLTSQLNKENNLIVEKYYFSDPRTIIKHNLVLLALPNVSNSSIFTYPNDFVLIDQSKEVQNWSLTDGQPLSFVTHLGCYLNDWNTVQEGSVALVKRGNCTFVHKILLAMKKGVSAILIYNDGLTKKRYQPLNNTRAPENNTIPALFLSYEAGMNLILKNITRIYMQLKFQSLPLVIITNVCAYTKSGNPNQTIVVSSHSDSVVAAPGLNDNGSGMAGTLAIALNLARLLTHSDYVTNMHSRIKFCWWGGEEAGLLGSKNFVQRAKIDGSLGLYSVNLDFDMLASPNFMFGIYDGKTANNKTTPLRAITGSNRITRLFIDYFDRNHLPWDYAEFNGRSDYGPFLAEGIASGGLFTGSKIIKNQEQRDRYSRILGSKFNGIANTAYDPCYHQKCDTLENLNTFAYLHMVKAAAYAIEYLAQLQDLNQWLYP